MTPFSFAIDPASGTLTPARNVMERRLSDMRGAYAEPASADDLVYEVRPIEVPTTSSNILSSTTTLYPGKVGREFYMTKGHFHLKRDRSEVYVGLSGSGLLVMATEDGEVAVEQMLPGSVNYVPGGWAHRSVNVGDKPLVFYAAYIADAGQDYATIERDGFPVIVVEGDAGPEVVPNPRFQRA
jgi:glucose-6-phosphate isomerase, archaeal